MKTFLANEINSFCLDYDFYDYQDNDYSFNHIYDFLSEDIYAIMDYFKSFIDESDDLEILNRAKIILNFLSIYERGTFIYEN